MSTTKEQIKKKQEEDKRNKEAFEQAVEQQRLEEERKKAALSGSSPKKADDLSVEEDKSAAVSYGARPSHSNADDLKKIFDDYKKKYPDTPIKDNILIFPTKEDALNFFEQQAKSEPPRKFLMSELGPDGNRTGFHAFSCGDGKLYKGSLNEIQDQLKEAQKANPDDPNIKEGLATIARTIANDFRTALKETKKADVDAPKQEHEVDAHQSPNPLQTKPSSSPS